MYNDHEQRRESIQSCWDCRNECQETLFNVFLDMGNRKMEERHVKLMLDCIAICQTAVDFMTRHSSIFDVICGACAKICRACAESCERMGGAEMIRCAQACRQCAESCERIGISDMLLCANCCSEIYTEAKYADA